MEKETRGGKKQQKIPQNQIFSFLQSPVSLACLQWGGERVVTSQTGFVALYPCSFTLRRVASADHRQTDSTTSLYCRCDSLKQGSGTPFP